MGRSISFDINANDRASGELLKVGRSIEQVERQVESLNRKRVEVDVDTARTERDLAILREELRGATGDRRIEVEADVRKAERELQRLRDARVKVDVDSGAAQARLEELHHQVDRLDGRKININVDADTGAVMAKIALVGVAVAGLAPLMAAATGGILGIGLAGAAGLGVLKGSLTGVGSAVTALGVHDGSVASKMTSNANAVKSAVEGVARAQEAVKAAIQGVGDAMHNQANAAQAVVDSHEGVRAAIEHESDAELSLADAQHAAATAQTDLNDARKQAAQTLKDLQRSEEDMRLSQASATLSVFEAEQRLQELLVDPKATDLQRARAQLTVDEAKQRQKEVGEDAKKLATTKADADAKGVEGSDGVQSALERQRQAQQHVVDATRAVRDANVAVEKSQRGVTEATYQYEQAVRRVADAHQAVRDRQRDVVDAQGKVREASQQAGTQGSASVNKLQQAMAALTPEGRRFAVFLRGLIDGPIKEIRDAGQRNLLPGLQSGMQSMVPYAGSIAHYFGVIAKNLGDMFAAIGPHLGPAIVQIARLAGVASGKGFQDAGTFIGFLVDKFTAWASSLKAGDITGAIGRVEGGLKKVWDAGKYVIQFLKWIYDHHDDMMKVSTSILAVRGAIVLLNLAMDANPVGLVIAAIAILAGGLYLLYQHSETFRRGVGILWKALQDGWKVISEALLPKLKELWGTIKTDLVPALEAFAKAVLPIITVLVEKLLPIYAKVWGAIVDIIKGVVKIISGVINVFTAILTGDWSRAWTGIKEIFSGIWDVIKGILSIAWTWIKTFLKAGLLALGTMWSTEWGRIKTSLSNLWDEIKRLLHAGWDWIRVNVFDKLTAGVKGLGPAFETAKNLIKAAWDKVKEVAAVPIRFVINTVIHGIAKAFNDIVGVIPGITKLPDPHTNFATGGPIRGPGHGTSDEVPIMASNGEWVIRAAAAKRLGPQTMHLINQADKYQISGDIATTVLRPRFADGGPVDPAIMSRVAAVKSWLPSLASHPYVWGAVGPGGYDCSGLVGEVWARLTGRSSYNRYMTTNSILASPGSYGFSPGPGMFTIGVSSEHTDGNLNGLGFEAPHTGVNVRIGNSAQPTSNFPSQFHLTSLGTAGAGTGGGGFFDVIGMAKSAARAVIDRLTGGWWSKLAGSGAFGQLGVGAGKALLSGIFDNGGLLQPGMTLAYNGTGQPERILTAQQATDADQQRISNNYLRHKALEQAARPTAAALPVSGGGVTINVTVNNAVVGNEQQTSRYIVQTIRSAVESGTLRFATR